MRRLAWLVLAAGCGDNVTPERLDAQSGTRLLLVHLDFADGTRQLVTDELFDAERDEPCRLAQWSDGLSYCTPPAFRTVFTDAACTVEVGQVETGETPRYFTRAFFLGDDVRPSRLYAAGAPIAAPAETFELRGDACEPARFAPIGAFFALGEELDRTALAEVATRDVPTDARLATRLATTEDGLRLPIALVDRELGYTCTLDAPNRGTAECIPGDAVEAVYFHDAACTQPQLSAARRPDLAAVITDGCATYHAVGDETGATPLFRKTPTCTEATAPSGDSLFLVGERLALAAARRERGAGARLAPITAAGLPDGYLFDRELGTDCRPLALGDELRCVPHATLTHGVYTDDTCTQPAIVALVPTRPCAAPVAYALRFSGASFEAYPIGEPAALVHEITTGDRCAPYLAPAGFASHTVGPPLAPAAFVAATRSVER